MSTKKPVDVIRIHAEKAEFKGDFLRPGQHGYATDTSEVAIRTEDGEYLFFVYYTEEQLSIKRLSAIAMDYGAIIDMTHGAEMFMSEDTLLSLGGGSALTLSRDVRFAAHGKGGWCGLNGCFSNSSDFPAAGAGVFNFDGNTRIYQLTEERVYNASYPGIPEGYVDKYRAGDIIYFTNLGQANSPQVTFWAQSKGGATQQETVAVPRGTALALMIIDRYSGGGIVFSRVI